MRFAKAFAPANISLIFEVIESENPLLRGSNGVGFTADMGVTATVFESVRTQVLVNGAEWDFPTVRTVLEKMGHPSLCVSLSSLLPFGCGFGLSGASALCVAYATNELFGLKKTAHELYEIAHYAEVVNGTGLGDVEGQVNGGFLIKKNHQISRLSFTGDVLYAVVFAPLKTSDIISSPAMKHTISAAGKKALAQITLESTLREIFSLSHTFSKEAGLILDPRVAQAIVSVEKSGGNASMIMLGHAVVATQKEGLERFGSPIPLTVSEKKVMVLE